MSLDADSETVGDVPEMLAERLDESGHHSSLEESIEAVKESVESADGYPFDREAQDHLRTALRHIRQARELHRAHSARTLIGDIEQRAIDTEEEPDR